MTTIAILSDQITKWSQSNFGNTPVEYLSIGENGVELNWMAPLLGMGEEIGELSKQSMPDGIRWYDLHETVDAIADIGIYFCDYLGRRKTPYSFSKIHTPVPKQFCAMMASAYGSILHCELKHAQRIRGMDDPEKFAKAHSHACAMFYESLSMGCESIVGKKLEEVIDSVFKDTVEKRNFIKNKLTG